MNTTLKYTLADRPKWWLPLILWLGSMLLEWIAVKALNGSEGGEAYLDVAYMADEAVLTTIGILFYAGIFWLVSLAVDKVDQLVWLNASVQQYIIE